MKQLLLKTGYWLACVLGHPIFSPSVAAVTGQLLCLHCGRCHGSLNNE